MKGNEKMTFSVNNFANFDLGEYCTQEKHTQGERIPPGPIFLTL